MPESDACSDSNSVRSAVSWLRCSSRWARCFFELLSQFCQFGALLFDLLEQSVALLDDFTLLGVSNLLVLLDGLLLGRQLLLGERHGSRLLRDFIALPR